MRGAIAKAVAAAAALGVLAAGTLAAADYQERLGAKRRERAAAEAMQESISADAYGLQELQGGGRAAYRNEVKERAAEKAAAEAAEAEARAAAERAEAEARAAAEAAAEAEARAAAEAEARAAEAAAICALPAGTVVDDSRIDFDSLPQYFPVSAINEGDAVYGRIIGKSYVDNPDIALSSLRYIKTLHRNFAGQTQVGEIIVNEAIAADVADIFLVLYESGYQINSMFLIDDFWTGDGLTSDVNSIAHDNTSGFCYRRASAGDNLSNHAFGLSIDLNPLENPFVYVTEEGSYAAYPESEAYVADRELAHCITHSDLAYQVFAAHGFTWGGDWPSHKDYQHFDKI